MNEENPNFRLKPVAEFLDGNHHFFIPSYQRGFRWDKKQVEDLLKDISKFAEDAEKGDFYCLQPIVVQKQNENEWIVVDGQQRLTTLYLLLNYIKRDSRTSFVVNSHLYDIKYYKRNTPDFNNPQKETDIDSFYIYDAKSTIEKWFIQSNIRISSIEDVLFNNYPKVDNTEKANPQVKFIWYVLQNNKDKDKDKDDLTAIKSFNNLNKGKIRLTNAELIKALFILNEAKKKENKSGVNEFELAFEWNQIENTLHDDKFWRFLTNTDYNPATRIDLIFDFLTEKKDEDDGDFSYRKFQALYDGDVSGKCWQGLKATNFKQAWEHVKVVFQSFVYWYENDALYHYIGYLLSIGTSHKDIYAKINLLTKDKMVVEVKSLIKMKTNISKEKIEDLDFNKDKEPIRKILLLFNIESCTRMGGYRFDFERYKKTKNEIGWDVEHIASQTENTMQKTEAKITWLGYLNDLTCDKEGWEELKKEGLDLLKILETVKKDDGNKFDDIYQRIVEMIEPANENAITDKDSIVNLTLLDAGTNRGYGNALFPTKRQFILEKDKKGVFIPPCTKQIFLKYYTVDDKKNSQWKNAWKQSDGEDYLKAIHNTIDEFLK
jgi:hypothetical protein